MKKNYKKLIFIFLIILAVLVLTFRKGWDYDKYYNHITFEGDTARSINALTAIKSYIENDKGNPEVKNLYLTNHDNLMVNNQDCGSVYAEGILNCKYLAGRPTDETKNAIQSLLILKESEIPGGVQRYHDNVVLFEYREYSKYSGEHDWRIITFKNNVNDVFLSDYEIIDSTADLYLLEPKSDRNPK